MKAPQAIETRYRGYRFRSRLEARWAVFFDALNVPWEYEPEGFDLPSGPYLPDFYLPTEKRFMEVKPQLNPETATCFFEHGYLPVGFPGRDEIQHRDLLRWVDFASDSNGLFVFYGPPGLPVIAGISKTHHQRAVLSDGSWAMAFNVTQPSDATIPALKLDPRPWIWQERDDDQSVLVWPCLAFEPIESHPREEEVVEMPIVWGEKVIQLQGVLNPGTTKHHDAPRLLTAYTKARSARFEWGEDGCTG